MGCVESSDGWLVFLRKTQAVLSTKNGGNRCFFFGGGNGSHIHFGGATFVFGGVEALKRDGVSDV